MLFRSLETNPDLAQQIVEKLGDYFQDFGKWLSGLLPQLQTVMTTVSGGVWSAVNFVMDLLVGIIASVYLLATKERCAAYGRKLVYSLFPREQVGLVLRGTKRADTIFSGFVRGKLLDSIIIGILCFVCCSILKFPYTPLVSVFVGVTNVIPFFGPFLGAIPSTFLILLVSPRQALYFVIFVLALQQLDGNVIGPKILGNTTGLSSLLVIIAILVGGGFFGVAGYIENGDPYRVAANFESFGGGQSQASELYQQEAAWQRMSLMNVAGSGFFCADRAIQDYARDIWYL